eukprot:TRINITY_DN1345_c4_g1_i2.p1 TRINITY_DN1345_c4_g1~~TRINITY_DN1345_c4_g1_i2.p1  ORF type:complete len:168 (+),score=30.07 TRINITY_DN1345_c4_g1_i2:55-504(+)
MKCRYCGKKGEHFSSNCANKPEWAKGGEPPPPECDVLEEGEIEASERALGDLQEYNLQEKGYLSPEAPASLLQALQPDVSVAIPPLATLREQMAHHWIPQMDDLYKNKGKVVRALSTRNILVEFEYEPTVNTISTARLTLPAVCLEPVG